MSSRKKWDELYEEASQEVLSWRRKHRKATLTEIEDTEDSELARMRAQMIEELAMASSLADLNDLPAEERPKCPVCGEPISANGKLKRQLVTEHEEAISLSRSKGVCPQCGASSFPPG